MKISPDHGSCNQKLHTNSEEFSQKPANGFQTVGETIPTPSYDYSKIEPLFIDAIGRKVPTYIEDDNVLIFGENSKWNQKVAKTIVDASHKAGHSGVIVYHEKFLSLSPAQKRFGDTKNIIICNDVYLGPAQLSVLKKFTSTQILFKIPGLVWKFSRMDAMVTPIAKPTLKALEIDESKFMHIGLLASLDAGEFCVCQNGAITKRVML